jgi:hypothetical protein
MRRALALAALALLAGPARAIPPDCVGPLTGAMYNTATQRYGHAVLGARSDWTSLTVFIQLTMPCRAGSTGSTEVLPNDMVFEDHAPLLADLTGDGVPEILVVESHDQQGSRLAVWGQAGPGVTRIAATPFIGTRHRWLAQIGAADMDGDGRPEIAYIDRPHLARTLRLWQLRDGALVELAALPGLTNHHFGDPLISGGFRTCAGQTEIVVASADWSDLMAVGWDGAALRARRIGGDTSAAGFATALACAG